MGVLGRGLSGLGQVKLAGSCEQGDEHSVSIKYGKFLDG
jgi:hypothetical protein